MLDAAARRPGGDRRRHPRHRLKVVSPEEVEVDIAPGVRVKVLRSTITSVLAKPDPAAAREAAKEKDGARREADKV
jgi:preprotein translocase subunit YajC